MAASQHPHGLRRPGSAFARAITSTPDLPAYGPARIGIKCASSGLSKSLVHAPLPSSAWLPRCRVAQGLCRAGPVALASKRVTRKKDPSLDKVIEGNKRLKIARRIAELLLQEEGQTMTLKTLGKFRSRIGLTGGRRCVVLLKRFPGLFVLHDEGAGNIWFTFTRRASEHFAKEAALRESMEALAILKVRKILMMAPSGRVRLESLGHIRRELGLPDNFREELIHEYPECFRITDVDGERMLELSSWDPELAVSVLQLKERLRSEDEQRLAREESTADLNQLFPEQDAAGPSTREGASDDGSLVEAAINAGLKKVESALLAQGGRVLESGHRSRAVDRTDRVWIELPPGLKLPQHAMRRLRDFYSTPYVSPYDRSVGSGVDPNGLLAERRWVAVLHELISLTVEKRLLVDHLTHFRRDLRLTQHIYALLLRHPEYFYISGKGVRHSVFLREAYSKDVLIERDELSEALMDLRSLSELKHKPKIVQPKQHVDDIWDEESSGEEEFFNDWSDDEGSEHEAAWMGDEQAPSPDSGDPQMSDLGPIRGRADPRASFVKQGIADETHQSGSASRDSERW